MSVEPANERETPNPHASKRSILEEERSAYERKGEIDGMLRPAGDLPHAARNQPSYLAARARPSMRPKVTERPQQLPVERFG